MEENESYYLINAFPLYIYERNICENNNSY